MTTLPQISIRRENLPAIGEPLNGGFFAGLFRQDGSLFALSISPKGTGSLPAIWGEHGQRIGGADSFIDGEMNTQAMAAAGYEVATRVLALSINGYDDWYIPARDELEILFRSLKPTDDGNACTFRDGDNPSSVPPGYPYTESTPVQTIAGLFVEGGEQAMEANWYWSSTQSSADGAWLQFFSGGGQGYNVKGYVGRVRAVRRSLVIE